MGQPNRRFMKPFSLLIKPVGSRCNLDCRYCFYKGTDDILGGRRPAVMHPSVLERMFEDYLGLGFPTSSFIWQGGEPTLAGIDFYRQVVKRQMAHGHDDQIVANALQTNGMLINDIWSEFLAEYSFLVGLSLDGPAEVHNHYRTDKHEHPTFDRVMASADLFRRNGVEFNILCMITRYSEKLGSEIYRFFVREGFHHLQFIPCIEYDSETGAPSPYNASPLGYGQFMNDVFDEWYDQDAGRIYIRTFESLVARLVKEDHLCMCNMGKICNHYLVVENEGDVYPCDFFVSKHYYLGNLMESSLAEIYFSNSEQSFSYLKNQYPKE